jgi:hypothetical protein
MKGLSLNDRVRQEAQNCGGTFSYGDLGDKLGLQSRADLDHVKRAVRNLVESGEIVRVRPGWFNWQGKNPGPPNQKEVMWRVLRARRVVTVTDLQELAGASREYAQEFMGRLEKQGVVQRLSAPGGANHPDKFRLVDDPGPELPRDEDKAEYLRRRREQKKAALAKLDEVYAGALDVMQKAAAARMAVSALEES